MATTTLAEVNLHDIVECDGRTMMVISQGEGAVTLCPLDAKGRRLSSRLTYPTDFECWPTGRRYL